MKLHQRDGVFYRELEGNEKIMPGDLISYDPADNDEDWDSVASTIGSTPDLHNDFRSKLSERPCVWLREIARDALIVEMLKIKQQKQAS